MVPPTPYWNSNWIVQVAATNGLWAIGIVIPLYPKILSHQIPALHHYGMFQDGKEWGIIKKKCVYVCVFNPD